MSKAALIIAVDEYDDERFDGLRAPANDAEGLRDVLGDHEIGAFDVTVLPNPNAPDALRAIEEFFANRHRDDLLVLYFTCHGIKDPIGRLHLVMKDTRFGLYASTAVSASWLAERINDTRSRRVVLFLDCCYSGAYHDGLRSKAAMHVDPGEQLGGRGRVVITASSAVEYSFESDQLSQSDRRLSIFTKAVIEGLRTGDADRDNDGRISVDDLFAYVEERVALDTPQQTPLLTTTEASGRIFLAENAGARALPLGLRGLLASADADERRQAVDWLDGLLAGNNAAVRRAAERELVRLSDDDSRRVSSAAQAALDRRRAEGGVAEDEEQGGSLTDARSSDVDIGSQVEREGPLDARPERVPPAPRISREAASPAEAMEQDACDARETTPGRGASERGAIVAGGVAAALIALGLVLAANISSAPYFHGFGGIKDRGLAYFLGASPVILAAVVVLVVAVVFRSFPTWNLVLGGVFAGAGATLALHAIGDAFNGALGAGLVPVVPIALGALIALARGGSLLPREVNGQITRTAAVGLVLVVGAVLVGIACFVSFTHYTNTDSGTNNSIVVVRSVWDDNPWRLLELAPVVAVASLAGVMAISGTLRRAEPVAGVLFGCGIVVIGTWLRYAGVPLLLPASASSHLQSGGWLGLAGAVLVVAGAAALARHARAEPDAVLRRRARASLA
jgi:hypothetical protein